MSRRILLVESGGTKSDWAFLENGAVTFRFTASGLHPSSLSDQKKRELVSFLKDVKDYQSFQLSFYGAGCLHESGAKLVKEFLMDLGFSRCDVFSDLHAAGRAAYGLSAGWTAILGTGSVVFYIDHGQVNKVEGGKGHLIGDEGSAFYFAKLVVSAWKQGNLSLDQLNYLNSNFPDWIHADLDTILNNKTETAALAALLAKEFLLFKAFHVQNIDAFFSAHPCLNSANSIAFVGSYAWHLSELIREACGERHLSIATFIQSPMDYLIEQST